MTRSPQDVQGAIESGDAVLIDVRREHEWQAGHIPGAEHIELNQLDARAAELGKDKPLILYCRDANRSSMAAEALADAGYDAEAIDGGITAWAGAGLPLEPADGHVAESGEAAEILRQRGRYVPFPEDPEAPSTE